MKTYFKHYDEDGINEIVYYNKPSHWRYTCAVIAIIIAAIVITLIVI